MMLLAHDHPVTRLEQLDADTQLAARLLRERRDRLSERGDIRRAARRGLSLAGDSGGPNDTQRGRDDGRTRETARGT
jgi:hypothetical protein